jgi:hypothetical protein
MNSPIISAMPRIVYRGQYDWRGLGHNADRRACSIAAVVITGTPMDVVPVRHNLAGSAETARQPGVPIEKIQSIHLRPFFLVIPAKAGIHFRHRCRLSPV